MCLVKCQEEGRSTEEEASEDRRKAREDRAVGEGVKGTMILYQAEEATATGATRSYIALTSPKGAGCESSHTEVLCSGSRTEGF